MIFKVQVEGKLYGRVWGGIGSTFCTLVLLAALRASGKVFGPDQCIVRFGA